MIVVLGVVVLGTGLHPERHAAEGRQQQQEDAPSKYPNVKRFSKNVRELADGFAIPHVVQGVHQHPAHTKRPGDQHREQLLQVVFVATGFVVVFVFVSHGDSLF